MNQRHIEKILSRIGISAGMNGFRYIADALLMLDQEGVDDVKYTYLYHRVARKNRSTADRVERSMRYAFSKARGKSACRDLVEYYIGLDNRSNSASLQLLYLRARAEEDALTKKRQAMQERITEVPRQPIDDAADRLIRQMLSQRNVPSKGVADPIGESSGLGDYIFREHEDFREKLKGLVRELVREIMEN